jgi:hypothetical protein
MSFKFDPPTETEKQLQDQQAKWQDMAEKETTQPIPPTSAIIIGIFESSPTQIKYVIQVSTPLTSDEIITHLEAVIQNLNSQQNKPERKLTLRDLIEE